MQAVQQACGGDKQQEKLDVVVQVLECSCA
jgi:hypothetical protein